MELGIGEEILWERVCSLFVLFFFFFPPLLQDRTLSHITLVFTMLKWLHSDIQYDCFASASHEFVGSKI